MQELNYNKLKAMVHYIADAAPSGMLGKTKLNKILWFSDREMYLQTGKSISGETYLRFPQGPVSKKLLDIIKELEQEQNIVSRKPRYPYDSNEYISLKQPNISLFSSQEIDIISRQLAWIAPLSAAKASQISHDRTWQTTPENQEIPMYSVLAAKTRELTPSDIGWLYAEEPTC